MTAFEAAETPVPDLGPVSLRPSPRRILIPFGVDLQATTLFALVVALISGSRPAAAAVAVAGG